MVSEVSNLETRAWQRRSITRSNSRVECKSRWSNSLWLVTIERVKSRDIISFVKLMCQIRTSLLYKLQNTQDKCHAKFTPRALFERLSPIIPQYFSKWLVIWRNNIIYCAESPGSCSFVRSTLRPVHMIRLLEPIFTQIQRSQWREPKLLWAETMPENNWF